MAKSGLKRDTKTRQYDLLRPKVGYKEPPRPGSTIYCGQKWARKSHQDSAVRFVMAKSRQKRATKTSHQVSAIRFVTANNGPKKDTKSRQYDLLQPRVGQKDPQKPGSTFCYSQDWARESHHDSEVRFVTAKSGPEGGTKTR